MVGAKGHRMEEGTHTNIEWENVKELFRYGLELEVCVGAHEF
jgi:hypothetical protein